MTIEFLKYQGTGNDFVMIDDREGKIFPQLNQEKVAWLCDRRYGIGADGLILLAESIQYDFRMIYYNADGKQSTMCGNGGRCLAAFANKLGIKGAEYSFEAIDGLHRATVHEDNVKLEMTTPNGYKKLSDQEAWIDTGSPHYLSFIDGDLQAIDVVNLGRMIRYSDAFQHIGGTNVNFVEEVAKGKLAVRTYERGVEDETLSCGTGVTAAAYVYMKENALLSGKTEISARGGRLEIEVIDLGISTEKIFLSGPATFVFAGNINLNR